MNTSDDHSAHLPLAFDASLSMSMAHITMDGSATGIQSYTEYEKDTTPSSDIGILCSELSMASLFNLEDVPAALDSVPDTGASTATPSWEGHDITESPMEATIPCGNNSQFFLRIVESALVQGSSVPTIDNTYGTFSGEILPSSTFLPASGISCANTEQVYSASPVPSPCYSGEYNIEEYIRDMSPVTCVDPAAISPVPSLCYPTNEDGSPAVSTASSPTVTYHTPYSPVPSLYYCSESSPEVESPVQYRALLQPALTAVGPAPSPVEEESVLSRAYRAIGATLVPSSPSQFPSPTLVASASARKTASPSRKTVSSTSRRARQPISPPPRNLQLPLDPAHTSLTYEEGAFRCPVAGCGYKPPASLRTLDVRRHFETHRSEENKKRWVCCGVPVNRAREYGIEDVSGAYMWRGCWLVGGCCKGFSRRDSLTRHLDNSNNQCVGHQDMADYLTQSGLAEEA